MAASQALLGWNATLQIQAAGAGSFVTIGEITSCGEVGVERDAVEVTHFESPNAFKEYIKGLSDGGSIDFEGNYIVGNSSQMTAYTQAGNLPTDANDNFKIVFPSGSPITWSGFLTKWMVSPVSPGEARHFTASVKVTGKPVIP